MKNLFTLLLISGILVMNVTAAVAPKSLYDFTMKNIDGKDIALSAYRGKVLLIVNVASKCGYTSQYAGLEKLYKKYQGQGFEILGFPANDFGAQEPGSDAEIREFCSTNYGVSFPVFSKISVKGEDQHPLYGYLTRANQGLQGDVAWNFEKFLVGKDGSIIARYKSKVEPLSDELIRDIEAALK